jgi:hypothetical protein
MSKEILFEKTKDLFGGKFVLPPEHRLVCRFCVRLTPKQRERFFSSSENPSETLRNLIVDFLDGTNSVQPSQTGTQPKRGKYGSKR